MNWSKLTHKKTWKIWKLNKHTKTKSKPKPTCNCLCAYHCAQLSCTIQQRTVVNMFSPNLQTIITALVLSVRGAGKLYACKADVVDWFVQVLSCWSCTNKTSRSTRYRGRNFPTPRYCLIYLSPCTRICCRFRKSSRVKNKSTSSTRSRRFCLALEMI